MRNLLIIILIISGILAVGSIMLMTPKGGLGVAMGGASGSNEYGSKKSLESTLKKVATITGIVFVVTAFFLPYSS